jgi:hypothetical protein
MRAPAFWDYFDSQAAPKLSAAGVPPRADTFRRMFSCLDRLDRPVGILETGCVRNRDDWKDGHSTVLFDRYAESQQGSVVYTVDRDAHATQLCKSLVSERVKVHTEDSVAFLDRLSRERPADLPAIDLLYLDSFDIDWLNPWPSASHHLKELLAVSPLLSPETLVVVDDSPSELRGVMQPDNSIHLIHRSRIGGKGQLIAEYAAAVGIKPHFIGYQCGWIGLGRASIGIR